MSVIGFIARQASLFAVNVLMESATYSGGEGRSMILIGPSERRWMTAWAKIRFKHLMVHHTRTGTTGQFNSENGCAAPRSVFQGIVGFPLWSD